MDKNAIKLYTCLKSLNPVDGYKVVSLDEIKELFDANIATDDLKEQIFNLEKSNMLTCKYIDDNNVCYMLNSKYDYVFQIGQELDVEKQQQPKRKSLRFFSTMAGAFIGAFLAMLLFYWIFVW